MEQSERVDHQGQADLYVPGKFKCAKCGFTLMQSTLSAIDGSIGDRDQPGEICPNDQSPLWRVSWREQAENMAGAWRAAEEEVTELKAAALSPSPVEAMPGREALRAEIINTPETADFMAAVPLEAAHQRERWGAPHDAGKSPFDWFWLVGYLAQKAADAAVRGDAEKAKHHTISTAAALGNWHAQLAGLTDMRPGIGPGNGGDTTGSAFDLASKLLEGPSP